jgi:2-polyprenyl-3-methyl-5-hydroxy-6-metoxy-1,4-benzoquinol methylase
MSQLPLEWLLQQWRIQKVIPRMKFGGNLVDIGCDHPAVFINRVRHKMDKCIGLDIAVTSQQYDNVQIKPIDIEKTVGLPSQSADVITMMAVLEHMKYPQAIAKECFRILKPKGVWLVTVPTRKNKPLLELLAKMGLLRQEMIDQHENYFTHQDLTRLAYSAGFSEITVESFEWGLNTFMKAEK